MKKLLAMLGFGPRIVAEELAAIEEQAKQQHRGEGAYSRHDLN